MTTLAELFKSCRKSAGLSLREAAPMLDTGFGHLCEIENGKHVNLTIKTLRQAQLVYGISARTLWSAACESLATPGGGS